MVQLDYRRNPGSRMRILIGQPGYDLLNIGDVAMLQSCVARLRQQWPDAEIMVIADDAERLVSCCPGTGAVGRPFPLPRTGAQAVRLADIVVASGGSHISDTWWRHDAWWRHGTGVLGLLAMAQRLGKPTAMFGQGIGPISLHRLRAHARTVLPRLTVLGLREGRISAELALFLEAPPTAIRITGDDALELATGESVAEGSALGVDLRVEGYADSAGSVAAAIGALLDVAAFVRAPVAGLPVSGDEPDNELAAVRSLLNRNQGRRDGTLGNLTGPGDLTTAVAGCRAVVAESYHAAVFALAQGVPVVCLATSPWYEAQFAGLRALFPSACTVVSLAGPDLEGRLRTAIGEAWHLPITERAAALHVAEYQREVGRDAYRQLRDAVDKGAATAQRWPPPERKVAI